jgi:predicted nucleotide-binding protein (sugar kinase/HSP70/actin superfamily)
MQLLKFHFVLCRFSFIQEQMKDKSGKNANSSKIILHLQHSEKQILIWLVNYSYTRQVNSFNEIVMAVYQTVVLAAKTGEGTQFIWKWTLIVIF